MDWTYDANDHALYIALSKHAVTGQVEMSDGTIIDVDAEGDAVGIEVLRSWSNWDLAAVAERFGLGADTLESIRFVADSPLVRSLPIRNAEDRLPMVAPESAVESSSQAVQLQPA